HTHTHTRYTPASKNILCSLLSEVLCTFRLGVVFVCVCVCVCVCLCVCACACVQVFQTASERVETAALSALSALTACLSRSVISSDSDDSLHTLLDLVLKGVCVCVCVCVWVCAPHIQIR